MGITTYLFHKSNSLEKQKFNMFFLDMGENIHFHYRDLRIELSVQEFIELAEQFNHYSKSVLEEIDNGYKDGVLANTNDSKTLKTFWDKEKKLTHPVKYNEDRLLVEETQDGYHLHIRNYKILLREESFQSLVKAIAPIMPLLISGKIERDPVELLEQNELETRLISRMAAGDNEELIIEVDDTYRKKAAQVLAAIGYKEISKDGDTTRYNRENITVTLVSPTSFYADPSSAKPQEEVLGLSTFFTGYGATLDSEKLNLLKLKILSLLKLAESGQVSPFSLDNLFINRKTLNPAVDLFSASDADMAEEIEKFANLLTSHKLFFVKPPKSYLPEEKQFAVQDKFFDHIMAKLAIHDCVKKIYLLGSGSKAKLGRYAVPFVHFDWVKLNSDFDIYIELDPDSESEMPEEWEKKFHWNRAGCDYYHFGDVGDGMATDYAKQYPNVRFYDHLIEGYIFDPATGDKKKRDTWLEEVGVQCIFMRDRMATWMNEHYDVVVNDTKKFNVESFNQVYHIMSNPQDYALKIYDPKHLSSKEKKKISYEIGLLASLHESALEVALPVKNRQGDYITARKDGKAVLFNFAPGKYVAKPSEKQARMAGNLLARYHNEAKRYKTKQANNYSNKETVHYWLKAWKEYHDKNVFSTDIPINVNTYKLGLDRLKSYPTHCHGDLSLINYLFEEEKCWLIDFQSICYGPALIDLTNGMIEFGAGKNEFNLERMEHFRAGYEEIRPLSANEVESLRDTLVTQGITRQAKILRLHYGGFGYELKKERLTGLKMGIEELLKQED